MYPLVSTYLHHNKTKAAVIVLSFKSDFAARTEEASQIAKKLAMIAVGYECKSKEDLLNTIFDENLTCEKAIENLGKKLQEPVELLRLEVIDGFNENSKIEDILSVVTPDQINTNTLSAAASQLDLMALTLRSHICGIKLTDNGDDITKRREISVLTEAMEILDHHSKKLYIMLEQPSEFVKSVKDAVVQIRRQQMKVVEDDI